MHPSNSITNKLILNSVFYLRDPKPLPGQPDTAIAKFWNAGHRQISARVVGSLTSATASADLVIQLGIALGKGCYVTLSYITFHKIPFSNRWTFRIVALDFIKVGHHAKLVAIGSLVGIFSPDLLEKLDKGPDARSHNEEIEEKDEADQKIGFDTTQPSFKALHERSSAAVTNLFSAVVNQSSKFDANLAAYQKCTMQQKMNFYRLMNAYDNPLQNRSFTRLASLEPDLAARMQRLRAKWAPHIFITPQDLASSSYSYSYSVATWYAPHNLADQINDKTRKYCSDNDTFKKVADSFYFHCTRTKDLMQKILSSHNVKVMHKGAYPGAFASTVPEIPGYGQFCFCFNQSIGFMSKASVNRSYRTKVWLGFSQPIPINQETLNCIIYDDSCVYSDRSSLAKKVSEWAGFDIKFIPFSEARPILQAARNLNRGLPMAMKDYPGPGNILADGRPFLDTFVY